MGKYKAEEVHDQLDNMHGSQNLGKGTSWQLGDAESHGENSLSPTEEFGSHRRVRVQRFQDGRGEAPARKGTGIT